MRAVVQVHLHVSAELPVGSHYENCVCGEDDRRGLSCNLRRIRIFAARFSSIWVTTRMEEGFGTTYNLEKSRDALPTAARLACCPGGRPAPGRCDWI